MHHSVEPHAAADSYGLKTPSEENVRPIAPLSAAPHLGAGVQGVDDGERHVSLLGLFALVTLAGTVLAMRSWFAPPAFAGVAGMLVLGYLFFRSLLDLRGAVYTLGGWLLVLIYALAVAMALNPLP